METVGERELGIRLENGWLRIRMFMDESGGGRGCGGCVGCVLLICTCFPCP